MQIIFAGKAHPADDIGKHNLQRVYKRALDPLFGGRVAFVDDYDLHVAHFLVQGCDVWLNNPRKPMEASGTSGMKAAINGVPHLSIARRLVGRGLHRLERMDDRRRPRPTTTRPMDAADADALYRLLEEQVVPGVLRSRCRERSAPLAGDREGGHPHGGAAVLRAAHGEGIRRADVRAGPREAHEQVSSLKVCAVAACDGHSIVLDFI